MLTIKEIEKKDIKRIHQLETEGFPDPWSIAGIGESLEQPCTVLLGAWLSDLLAGYVICYCAADELEIARIAVDPAVRRKGTAASLLAALKDICLERGIRKILLDVRQSNKAAIRLYEKAGFIRDGVRKNFYTQPAEDAILMSFGFGK